MSAPRDRSAPDGATLSQRLDRAERALCVQLECTRDELELAFELGDEDDDEGAPLMSAPRDRPAPDGATPTEIPAVVRLDADRGLLYICALPAHVPAMAARMERDEAKGREPFHNCDDMGCGSFGPHIIAIHRLWPEEPRWDFDGAATPSGKALFRCTGCGETDPAPSKHHRCEGPRS